jgi:two-component system LytT family response regulator
VNIRTLIVDDEPLARERVKRFLGEESDIEIVGEAADGREAVEKIRTLRPDLVFLDIQIPELDGFGVLEEVGASRLPAVIFITAYDQYALKAFDFHALDYLLKPYDRERFRRALERARAQIAAGKSSDLDERLRALLENFKSGQKHLERLMIKSQGRVFFLRADEIDWIEAEGNYVRLHAGRDTHMLRETMNHLASRLDPEKFLRIHRSTLVNIERIKELQPMFSGDYTVVLRDGTQLTLSRTYRDHFLELFDNAS